MVRTSLPWYEAYLTIAPALLYKHSSLAQSHYSSNSLLPCGTFWCKCVPSKWHLCTRICRANETCQLYFVFVCFENKFKNKRKWDLKQVGYKKQRQVNDAKRTQLFWIKRYVYIQNYSNYIFHMVRTSLPWYEAYLTIAPALLYKHSSLAQSHYSSNSLLPCGTFWCKCVPSKWHLCTRICRANETCQLYFVFVCFENKFKNKRKWDLKQVGYKKQRQVNDAKRTQLFWIKRWINRIHNRQNIDEI